MKIKVVVRNITSKTKNTYFILLTQIRFEFWNVNLVFVAGRQGAG
jgi:hypothetical protein